MTAATMTPAGAPVGPDRIESFCNYIDGSWVAGSTNDWVDDVNPADVCDIVGRFPASRAADARAAVEAAGTAFPAWKRTPISVKINRTTTGNLINAPFGGLKRSSTSTFRESGRAALEFYTQIKTVYRGC